MIQASSLLRRPKTLLFIGMIALELVLLFSMVTGDQMSSQRQMKAVQGSRRVGPLFLFRSSAKNAEIVNGVFRSRPVYRTLGLSFGDEFPRLRDDIVARHRLVQTKKTGGGGGGRPTASAFAYANGPLSALLNAQNWHFDVENNKKELADPYYRPSSRFINAYRSSLVTRSRPTAVAAKPSNESGSSGSGTVRI